MWQLASKRVAKIYLAHVSALALIILLAAHSDTLLQRWKATIPYFADSPIIAAPVQAFLLGLALLYQPAYLDILPLYCVFILLTPKLISWFVDGKTVRVFAVSIALWLAAQLGTLKLLVSALRTLLPIDLGFFDIFAWQLLFVAGVYAGVYRYSGTKFSIPRSYLIVTLFVATALCLLRHGVFGWSTLQTIEFLTAKDKLGFLRLLNFAALTLLVVSFYRQISKIISQGWLVSLGQHSLQVYTYQVIMVFIMGAFAEEIRNLPSDARLITTLACVLSLFIPAWLHKKYRELSDRLSVIDTSLQTTRP